MEKSQNTEKKSQTLYVFYKLQNDSIFESYIYIEKTYFSKKFKYLNFLRNTFIQKKNKLFEFYCSKKIHFL